MVPAGKIMKIQKAMQLDEENQSMLLHLLTSALTVVGYQWQSRNINVWKKWLS